MRPAGGVEVVQVERIVFGLAQVGGREALRAALEL
jgi:hypothetical protein